MDLVVGFRVSDRHNGCAQKAGGIEALLAIEISDIFHCEGWTAKHLLGIGEVKAMLFQVARALGGFLREVHKPDDTYKHIYFKSSRKLENSFNDPASWKVPGKPEAPQIECRAAFKTFVKLIRPWPQWHYHKSLA